MGEGVGGDDLTPKNQNLIPFQRITFFSAVKLAYNEFVAAAKFISL